MKREVFVREKMSGKDRLEGEKNICISRHMHTHEYFKMQGLHPVQMLNLNPEYIMLAL